MGWGIALDGASPPPASLRYADAPPADFSQQDFWRWVQAFAGWDLVAGTGNPLANSYGMAQGRQAAGSGLPAYHHIARSRRGLPLSFTVQARLAPNGAPERRGRAIRMPGPSWRPARRRPISSGRRRARMGETSLPPCSARIGRPGWLLPGLRRKARRAGHEGRVPSACRATRAGLDRVRAVAVLADVVAARRAGPGAGAACGHAAGQFQPQGRHDRRARQAMSLHDVRNGVALRGVAQVARGGSASAASQSLRNDWLGEARLVQVRADTTVAMPPPFSGLRISRQVQVLSGRDMHGMMRTRSVVSAPRACRGGGYRRFRRNARAPWVNCWRRPSPLGAGPRCPWIGSRHGMTWQRPTACSRMGAAVRLLLSRSLPHPAHGAVHARRHASAPWLKYAAARWPRR